MDRRAHYLDTALGLFVEHGYHGVSMDQLVHASGGSKATLYRYFRSKEELFEAIIDDLRTGPRGQSPDEVDGLSLAEGLRVLGQATATAALDERVTTLLRLALGEYTRFPDLARTLFDRGPGASYGTFRDFLAAREARGEIVVGDRQIAAEQFLGGIIGHQQLRMALGAGTPTKAEIDRRVEAAVEAFVATYAVSPP